MPTSWFRQALFLEEALRCKTCLYEGASNGARPQVAIWDFILGAETIQFLFVMHLPNALFGPCYRKSEFTVLGCFCLSCFYSGQWDFYCLRRLQSGSSCHLCRTGSQHSLGLFPYPTLWMDHVHSVVSIRPALAVTPVTNVVQMGLCWDWGDLVWAPIQHLGRLLGASTPHLVAKFH